MSDETLVLIALAALFILIGVLIGSLLPRKKITLPEGVNADRRSAAPTVDDAKFETQKVVTYVLLAIFTGVTATILYQNDQSERSMILQTVINLTLLAVGYWVGASKAAADSSGSLGKIAEKQGETQAKAVAAARAPALTEALTEPTVTPAATNPETGNTPAAEVATQPKEPPK